jgi:hypothetical protein
MGGVRTPIIGADAPSTPTPSSTTSPITRVRELLYANDTNAHTSEIRGVATTSWIRHPLSIDLSNAIKQCSRDGVIVGGRRHGGKAEVASTAEFCGRQIKTALIHQLLTGSVTGSPARLPRRSRPSSVVTPN